MSACTRALFGIAAAVCPMSAAVAQDILHYKFDGACDSTAINYAAGSPAPAAGTIVTYPPGNPAASRTAGRFGLALAPSGGSYPGLSNYLETGWAPNAVTGSVSWACWLRVHPGRTLATVVGLFDGYSFRWFVIVGMFYTSGSVSTSFQSTTLGSLVQSGWTHVAVVVDGSTQTVTYYLNGTPQQPLSYVGSLNWTAPSMKIGGGIFANPTFDIDEFILAKRVMSAAEIAVLATDPRAGDAAFGTSSGPTFGGNGQRPVPGNQSYGLTLNANAGLAWLVFGQSRCTMNGGTITLPVDLGRFHPLLSGLQGQVDSDLGALALVIGGGATSIPFPLPNLPGLSGFECYGQALVLDSASLQFAASNPLAIGIGR